MVSSYQREIFPALPGVRARIRRRHSGRARRPVFRIGGVGKAATGKTRTALLSGAVRAFIRQLVPSDGAAVVVDVCRVELEVPRGRPEAMLARDVFLDDALGHEAREKQRAALVSLGAVALHADDARRGPQRQVAVAEIPDGR